MTNLSARTWVLMGFGLSLIAVVINVFVLASFNDKIKEADGELSKLTASLSSQATEINRAEIKYDLFTVLNHVSKLGKDQEKKMAGNDAAAMLRDYLSRNYAAVNDIPTSEYLKAVNEDLNGQLEIVEKYKTILAMYEQNKVAEAERLEVEVEKADKDWKPNSELGKKILEVQNPADSEKIGEGTTTDAYLAVMPVIKSSNEQYIANYQKKEARIKELQERKSNLSGWQNIFTYLAVSLQLFGLMFVVTKDLVKDTKERRDKAKKEAEKAEAEARQAESEAAESKARAKQADIEADKAVARAEKRIEKAQAQVNEALEIAADIKEEVEEFLEEDEEEEKI